MADKPFNLLSLPGVYEPGVAVSRTTATDIEIDAGLCSSAALTPTRR